MRLKDKVAIITGGTGALGKAVVSAFLEEGARVSCTYIVEEELKGLSSIVEKYKPRLILIRANVTKEKQVSRVVERTLQRFGRIDVLVNIVGGFTYATIVDTDEKTWDHMMNINLKSTFLCSKAVLPHMIKQNYGRIINVSSRPALRGTAGIGAYSASKAGVLNLTETIADEVRDYEINVNAILPSTIDTPANRKAMPKADFSKWVKPEEIARVMLFLASDDSKPISGAAIPVYGKA
ncbi:MAG TPA: SDR family NAD(P)-dependent oxidoreductase [Thermodesulfobacteriota bacterium]|jgi:NAD(P)-dependent dehydrogenase (short-subunit alcohol dehydrogenase family)|nr:SDR family NAD(P)-dependent oxidoreductase [Thermodesulfobacteriota bacterium]